MLRPFNSETTQEMLDMMLLGVVIDHGITTEAADANPSLINSLAATMVNFVRHNDAVTRASIEEKLMIPVTDEMRTVVREGRTFGIITGGKGN
jgi:hypothetical protein